MRSFFTAPEGAAQGAGESPCQGDVQGPTGRGTQCSGLGTRWQSVGHKLDSMIWEVFLKPHDPSIL